MGKALRTGFKAAAGLGLALLACALPVAAAAGPADLYYERTLMSVLGRRCGLFEPGVASALSAAGVQARSAALRGGAEVHSLEAIAARARARAAQQPCDSPDVAIASARVRSAFEGYSRLSRMSYPGEVAAWTADRAMGTAARWRLSQSIALGWERVVFGLVGRGGGQALMAVGAFSHAHEPYTARLVMRDVSRTLGPYLDDRGSARARLEGRLPPSGTIAFSAEARSPAGRDLLPADARAGVAFRFPPQALAALERLDPREALAVEFVFPGAKETTRRAYVEVGDFAAGKAFLDAGR